MFLKLFYLNSWKDARLLENDAYIPPYKAV